MPKRITTARQRYRRRRRLLSIREAFSAPKPGAGEPAEPAENPLAAEVETLRETVARQRADFDNFRRRTSRERDQLQDSAREEVLVSLLPVLDNFDRALTSNTNDGASLMQGIEMISLQLRKTLQDAGLTRITSVNKPFDPSEHDALMTEERADLPENTVAQELAPGYRYKDRVIRAAMVKVAKKPAAV